MATAAAANSMLDIARPFAQMLGGETPGGLNSL